MNLFPLLAAAAITLTVVAAPAQAGQTPGTIATVVGDGTTLSQVTPGIKDKIGKPQGVVRDRVGNLYYWENDSAQLDRLMKVDVAGVLTTIATGLPSVTGTAIDDAGNLYYSTDVASQVFKRDPQGRTTLVAGVGDYAGFAGDGGAAIYARFDHINAIAVDHAGNVFISDSFNVRVRRVDTAGVVRTVAGGGPAWPGLGGLATNAKMTAFRGVAVDRAGNLFIANDFAVSKVDTSGVYTRVAGTDAYTFTSELAADDAGNIYFVEGDNGRIWRIDHGTGPLTQVAGASTSSDEPALSSAIGQIAIDLTGRYLAIPDTGNLRVRVADLSLNRLRTVAGNGIAGTDSGGPATAASVDKPRDTAFDRAGNMYVTDLQDHLIRKVDTAGMITVIAGNGQDGHTGDGGLAVEAMLNTPSGIAVDGPGNVYFIDGDQVRKVGTNGILSTVAGTGVGGYSGDGGPATAAQLGYPQDVAIDAAGYLYITEWNNNRVRKVDTVGVITTMAGTGSDLCLGDGGPATAACLDGPSGVTVDGAGAVYIADTNHSRVRKVAANGTISTVAGIGTSGFSGDFGPATAAAVSFPYGVAVDAAGNVYIADSGNQRVRRVSPDGKIDTIAGTGATGSTGDGGLATSATFANLTSVSVDPDGGIDVADSTNNRVRRIVTVSTAPGAPVANDDIFAWTKGQTSATGQVLTNDTGTGLTVVATGTPHSGTVKMSANGSFTYTAAGPWVSADSFTYTVQDTSGRKAIATVWFGNAA